MWKERELEILLGKERMLKKQVDFVYKSIENGGFEIDGAFIPVEDKDDAFLISYQEQASLKSVRNDINELLKISIKLGLHSNPYGYIYEHKGGIVTKNISEFILKLNEQYSPA